MGPLGWQETIFIFILALLVFGPKKLPELGKTIGKALTEFRRASSDLKATFDREMNNLEREGDSLKEVTSSYQQEISGYDSEYNYDSSYDYGGSESSTTGGNGEGSAPADSAAASPSTTSASATEGAESEPGAAPEGAAAASEKAVVGLTQPADEQPAVEA